MSDLALAVLGARPAFSHPLPVGQLYFPGWENYVCAMRGIFDRQYYTNQGPLTQELESQLEAYLGVKHVICVANATIGLMMAAESLSLKGKVLTPAFTFIATAQSLTWAGAEPLFCDVDPLTHQLDPKQVERALAENEVSAVLAVNLWGDVCDQEALQALCTLNNVPLYYDSAHAFGCQVAGRHVGSAGALEVFSFHATKVLSATEGGCITTNDDALAARLRNIRSSYGAGSRVDVSRTANGRMSEAQAAIALLSLRDFPQILQRNAQLFEAYRRGLSDLSGLRLIEPQRVERSNGQYVVCEIDAATFGMSRDDLHAVLQADNVHARRYFHPGIHRCAPYVERLSEHYKLPVTESLCQQVLQLPIGQLVDEAAVNTIVGLIRAAHWQAARVCKALRDRP